MVPRNTKKRGPKSVPTATYRYTYLSSCSYFSIRARVLDLFFIIPRYHTQLKRVNETKSRQRSQEEAIRTIMLGVGLVPGCTSRQAGGLGKRGRMMRVGAAYKKLLRAFQSGYFNPCYYI